MKKTIIIITLIIGAIALIHTVNNRNTPNVQCVPILQAQSLECVEHDEPIPDDLIALFDHYHEVIECNGKFYVVNSDNFHCE